MADQFKIDGPTCISFSGGRTSAMMAARARRSRVVFAPVVTSPRAVALASGILSVIVLPLAEILKSAPVVPVCSVKAPLRPFNEITCVPQANVVPFQVGVWPVVVHESPVTVLPTRLYKPLPVNVSTFSLPLKVDQSVLVRMPVVVALAVGSARLETAVT